MAHVEPLAKKNGSVPEETTLADLVAGKDHENENLLLAQPVRATLLGAFKVASIFTNTSFGLCHAFGLSDHVTSQRVRVGAVPVPSLESVAFEWLEALARHLEVEGRNHVFCPTFTMWGKLWPLLTICFATR